MAIKTKAQAVEALARVDELNTEIKSLMWKSGITELEAEKDLLRGTVTQFFVSKKLDRLDFGSKYGKLIQPVAERIWVGTKDDITADMPKTTKSLKSLVSKEVWAKVTRRVVDRSALDDALESGLITIEQVAPAYVERMKAPYLRVFESSDAEE